MRIAGWITVLLLGSSQGASAGSSAAMGEFEPPSVSVVELSAAHPGTCGVTVRTEGLPAVSTDGSQLVYETFISAGETDVHRLRLGDVEIDVDDGRWGAGDCEAYAEALRDAAFRANAMLASERWRPMAELDVLLPVPDDDAHALDPMALEPEERPVELVLSGGNLVARTTGVGTYLRVPAPWSRTGRATLQAVHGDMTSGALLVEYAQPKSGSTHQVVTRAPQSLFDRLAQLASGAADERRG